MKSGDILGTTVREARISAGMTQERLAEEMGVTPTHIKHIESGHRKPSVELLFALARKLDISLDSLLFPQRAEEPQICRRGMELMRRCSESQAAFIVAVLEDLLKSGLR